MRPAGLLEVHVYDGEGDRLLATIIPFRFYEGNVNVAMGDVDGDGILDLLVGSGKDHAPEVVAYAGASIVGKGMFGTELARFQPFDSSARSGVTVASGQIDGTQSDNLIVGSPAGLTDEVKIYDVPLAGANRGPTLFASFKPYGEDKSGVNVAAGMVDFITGREDIITAPGPGTPTEIKTFVYTLFHPNEKHRKGEVNPADTLANNTSFFPFGKDYSGGISLSTGWIAGSLGGAKSIIASQLAGSGTVKTFSSGSALDEGPSVYLGQCRCGKDAPFRETSSFNPFTESGGVHVATTSTTTGAHVVVSGTVDGKTKGSVLKYDFVRPQPDARMLEPVRLGEVWSGKATAAAALGGN